MRNLLSLTKSLFKSNVGFTIGLILMLSFGISLMQAMCVVPSSMDKTFSQFFSDFNMHEGYVYYDNLKYDKNKSIEDSKIEGINKIDEEKYLCPTIKSESNDVFPSYMFSTSSSTVMKTQSIEHAENSTGLISIQISRYFSIVNNIHAGDCLYVSNKLALPTFNTQKNAEEYIKVFISDVVMNPETIHTFYDDYSWCDSGTTPYVFCNVDDMDSIFNTKDFFNISYIYFNGNVLQENKQALLDSFCSKNNISSISNIVLEDSEQYKSFQRITSAVGNTLNYVPLLIMFLSFICTFLFIKQVIVKASSLQYLLFNLGYTVCRVRNIFLTYMLLCLLASLLIGSAGVVLLVCLFSNVFMDSYNMPYFSVDIIWPKIIFWMIFIICICILITIINFSRSSRNVFMYSAGISRTSFRVYLKHSKKKAKFRLKNVFIQNALSQMGREKARTFATCCCLACSVVLSCVGASVLFSYNAQNEYTYSHYLNYDAVAFYDGSNQFLTQMANVNNVYKYEPFKISQQDAYFHGASQNIDIRGICDDSTLVTPVDANMNIVKPSGGAVIEEYFAQTNNISLGDTIKIADVDFTVTGIARECVDQAIYITYEDMDKVCSNYSNAIYIKFNDAANDDVDLKRDALSEISKLPGYSHHTFLQLEKEENNHYANGITLFTYLILIEALLVGLIVVINTVHLNIFLRLKEHATLLALGTKTKNIFQCVSVEYAVFFIVACIIGLPFGFFSSKLILYLMSSRSNIYYFVHPDVACLLAAMATFLYVILGIVYTMKKIKHLNFTMILNDKE